MQRKRCSDWDVCTLIQLNKTQYNAVSAHTPIDVIVLPMMMHAQIWNVFARTYLLFKLRALTEIVDDCTRITQISRIQRKKAPIRHQHIQMQYNRSTFLASLTRSIFHLFDSFRVFCSIFHSMVRSFFFIVPSIRQCVVQRFGCYCCCCCCYFYYCTRFSYAICILFLFSVILNCRLYWKLRHIINIFSAVRSILYIFSSSFSRRFFRFIKAYVCVCVCVHSKHSRCFQFM